MNFLHQTHQLARLMTVIAFAGTASTHTFASGPVEYEIEPLYSGFPGSDDDFGFSLAVNGSYIAIGARLDDIDGVDSGAVYVYNRAGRNFLYAPFASDVGPGDLLGYSVAIDNGLLYATAPSDDVGGVEDAGSVYVFDLSLNGRYVRRLTAPTPSGFDNFGWHVSAGSGLILVGAPSTRVSGVQTGVAHGFASATFNYLTALFPTDGNESDFYGGVTAVSPDYAVVGSGRNDIGIGIGDSGAVYVYDFMTGSLLHKLIPHDPQAGAGFGGALAIQGELIAVGAPFTDDRGVNSGSVYLFNAVTGNQIAKIIADDTDEFDWFGNDIALDDETLVIGAPFSGSSIDERGSVYVYDLSTLAMIDKISIPVGVGSNDRFGFSVAAGEGEILTSNYNQIENGMETGVAYFIDAICPADINDDGSLDFFDVSDLINNRPDYNNDGTFNFFDVSAFLNDYNMGCP